MMNEFSFFFTKKRSRTFFRLSSPNPFSVGMGNHYPFEKLDDDDDEDLMIEKD